MNEKPVPEPQKPSIAGILFLGGMVVFFTVKVVRWWAITFKNDSAMDSMSTWGWARLVFWHIAVVFGLIALIGVIRTRRAATNEPPSELSEPNSPTQPS